MEQGSRDLTQEYSTIVLSDPTDTVQPSTPFYKNPIVLRGTATGLFFFAQLLVDAFDIEETVEYVKGPSEGFTWGYVGLGVAALPDLLLALTVNHYLKKHQPHHHHSMKEKARDWGLIGGPFALIGMGAALDTMSKFKMPLPLLLQIPVAFPVSVLVGYGAMTIHSFHVHETSGGEGISAYFKGLYKTFHADVHDWDTRWDKWGILVGHGFEGYVAAELFLKNTNLQHVSLVAWPLKCLLPLAVALFEGNTEASCIDKPFTQLDLPRHIKWPLEAVLVASSILHAWFPVLGVAYFVGNFTSGPWDGMLFNSFKGAS